MEIRARNHLEAPGWGVQAAGGTSLLTSVSSYARGAGWEARVDTAEEGLVNCLSSSCCVAWVVSPFRSTLGTTDPIRVWLGLWLKSVPLEIQEEGCSQ